MASIICGNCHLTHDSVEMVRSCYTIQAQDPTSVTPSQAKHTGRPRFSPDPVVDSFIPARPAIAVAGTDKPTNRDGAGMTIPGFYRTGEQIYKVTPAKSSNRTFAHELLESDGAPSWKYVGLANRYVPMFAPKLSLEDAAQYGKTHGYCIICGRQLTAEESVAAGIGPICAGRL